MKKVSAYVRAEMASRVVEAMTTAGLRDFTIISAQRIAKGLDPSAYQFSMSLGEKFEPVAKLEVVCRDSTAERLVDLIRTAAFTCRRGDGMVFVSPVEDAVHIVDGRSGEQALDA